MGAPEHYRRRIIDDELDALLPELPAIALQGPKGVGKTRTAGERSRTTFRLDDPAQRSLLDADPERLRTSAPPILIDDWQRWPQVWDIVQRLVDDRAEGGRFLLTGSAAPAELALHSGAGRIVTRRMRPLSMAERGLTTPTVSLAAILGTRPGVLVPIDGATPRGLDTYVEEIVASGYPVLRDVSPRAREAALDGYLDSVLQREFPEQGLHVRRPATLRAWLAAYAAATASTASYNHILDAASPGESDRPARTTVTGYRDVLARLWLLDPVPGWTPPGSWFSRLAQAPKHHLADPALAARLLGATSQSLLTVGGATRPTVLPHSGTLLGALFESLVTLSVQTYAQAAGARVHHLRTHGGTHEIDLIVERPDGGIVALETKVSRSVEGGDVRHLAWLRAEFGDRFLDAAVITTGEHAYRRQDGIAVVPAVLLGP